QQGQVNLGHVQADELWVKVVGGKVWMALAPAVPYRLWLGGAISPQRDEALIRALVAMVAACASNFGVLVCVDGLASYVSALARRRATLTAGMYLVGCAYNFCWDHHSLRLPAPAGAPLKWHERTPAMAAGLTDHRWTMSELLHYQIPLPARVAPKRRGRPP